ncbi:MAG: alpha/beta fold hydrolase, partial [Thermoleophilia bacterium]|nr:alpha/beta fold hydrolase [Thermoleophilia bacterium]
MGCQGVVHRTITPQARSVRAARHPVGHDHSSVSRLRPAPPRGLRGVALAGDRPPGRGRRRALLRGLRLADRDRRLTPPPAAEPFEVARGEVTLRGESAGEGDAVLLLHGLTATRRYVVHGSRAIERAGRRVVMYDARGHGISSPAGAYDYAALAADAIAVLDHLG